MDNLSNKLVFTLLSIVVITTIVSTLALFHIEQNINNPKDNALNVGPDSSGDLSIKLITPNPKIITSVQESSEVSIRIKE